MKKYTIAIKDIYGQGQPITTIEVEAENEKLAYGLIFHEDVRARWGPDNVNRFDDELYDVDLELVYIREHNE